MGLATADTLLVKDRIKRAKKLIDLAHAKTGFIKISGVQLISGKNGRIQLMWKQMEELLFSMSKADGKLGMKDFWQMNVYEFFRYKELLVKHIKKQKKK